MSLNTIKHKQYDIHKWTLSNPNLVSRVVASCILLASSCSRLVCSNSNCLRIIISCWRSWASLRSCRRSSVYTKHKPIKSGHAPHPCHTSTRMVQQVVPLHVYLMCITWNGNKKLMEIDIYAITRHCPIHGSTTCKTSWEFCQWPLPCWHQDACIDSWNISEPEVSHSPHIALT